MKINWFPGHMSKALAEMKRLLRAVDVIIYVLDARAPLSSLNPSLTSLAEGKPILYAFNKIDMADERRIREIVPKFRGMNFDYVCMNSTMSGTGKLIRQKLNQLAKPKIDKFAAKGVKTTVRAMVVGVPNSGKSTLVNNLCGKAKAITGNKPGVTKSSQWLKIGDNIELCDTPGTLYPNLSDQTIAKHLLYIGSIKDDVVVLTELAQNLMDDLYRKYPSEVDVRFKGAKNLAEVAKVRGFMIGGGEVDEERAAAAVLDDFRKGRIGRLTLD